MHDDHLKAYLRTSFPTVRDVDDIVQESYLRIWRRQSIQPVRTAKAFLFTIARRQTNLPPLPEALTDAFANDPTKQVQWAAFLRRNSLTGLPERFSEVVDVLRTFFEPVLRLW